MQSFVGIAIILAFLLSSASSWRIEKGGNLTKTSSSRHQQQEERRTPPNTADPDYFHPSSSGGIAQRPGHDGTVLFVARVHHASSSPPTRFETVDVPPLELRAQYFLEENVVQEYVVPGDGRRRPYDQEVRVKIWGGGGGGCDGGERFLVRFGMHVMRCAG